MMIGREEEQKRLRKAYESDHSEFVVVYGRRRVGKTFLIRETFGDKFMFQHVGLAKKNNGGCTRPMSLTIQSLSLSMAEGV